MLALGQMSNVEAVPGSGTGYRNRPRQRYGGHGRRCTRNCAFPADVNALDIDFYAFSGHKLYGPTGIGALYGKPELLAQMTPWLGGGKMITEVTFDGFRTQDVPYRLEAGTPNVAGVIGLSAALEWLAETDRSGRKLEPGTGDAGRRSAKKTSRFPFIPRAGFKPAGL
jgi:cysteine sulfinate desulfinase